MLVGLKADSLDLRQKRLRTYEPRLGSPRALAALCGVRQSFVEEPLRRRRTTGNIAPRPHAGGRRALCEAAALAVTRRLVHEPPAATLAELWARLRAQQGLRASVPTMGRLVLALSVPRHNSRATPASGTPRGSSRRGRPIQRNVPGSTLGASGASAAEVFRVSVAQVLRPTRRPGDIAGMDTLRAHHAAGIREASAQTGARLRYLPPYSPDVAPVERCGSQLNPALRAAKARPREAREHAIVQALGTITLSDARSWFHHCGSA